MEIDLATDLLAACNHGFERLFQSESVASLDDALHCTRRATVAVFGDDRQDQLVDCLESIRNQTARNLDLIVVVHSARDGAAEIAEHWLNRHAARFDRTELWCRRAAPDPCKARDLAFGMARTDCVLTLAASRIVYPRCVESLLSAMNQSLECAAHGVGERRGVPSELMTWRPWSSHTRQDLDDISQSILIRKVAWTRAGGYEALIGGWQNGEELGIGASEKARPYLLVPEVLYRISAVVPDAGGWSEAHGSSATGGATDWPAVLRELAFPNNSRRRATARRVQRALAVVKNDGMTGLLKRARSRWHSIQDNRYQPPAIMSKPRPEPMKVADGGRIVGSGIRRFAVMSSSRGNYFFNEIRDLIAAGLSELGHSVLICDERDGFHKNVDQHVIIAPHEFFFLGEGEALRRSEWPQGTIMVSTEQPSTSWFALAWECLLRADVVWDINASTAMELRRRGIASHYLALGYAPSYSGFSQIEALPLNAGTRFLEASVRSAGRACGPLADRSIDVLFIGSHTHRRGSFLAWSAETLSAFRTYLHLHDPSRPALEGQTTFMDTATAIGLSQRSKVLLNIHHGKDVYFEWHRIVLHGLWQKTLVVSEPCSEAPPFRAGVHYVEAELSEIPRLLCYYLQDPQGQREAQKIADAGHRMLTEGCRLSGLLEKLLAGEVASGPAIPVHRERMIS